MSTDKCNTCLVSQRKDERRKPYPKNIPKETESDCSASSGGGGIWGFFNSKPKDNGCGCGPGSLPPDGDSCSAKSKSSMDSCNKSDCPSAASSSSTTSTSASSKESGTSCCSEEPPPPKPCKKPLGTGAMPGSPMPATKIPALMIPAWLKCPARVTVPPFEVPCGVEIRPISEGGRNSTGGSGGKCDKCGQHKPVPTGPPKVSPNCPMVKNKRQCGAPTAQEAAKKEGLWAKIMAMLGLGAKKAEKGVEKAEKEAGKVADKVEKAVK